MRLYVHLFEGDTCEAKGCRIRTATLWPAEGGLVRACCPRHAQEAHRQLPRVPARRAREARA